MIRVKTFTSQLKIFHTRNELLELDQAVNDFVASQGIRKVISVSDAVTTGVKGEAIGIIRGITYQETGGEAWEDLRTGAEAALEDLKKAGERALGKRKK